MLTFNNRRALASTGKKKKMNRMILAAFTSLMIPFKTSMTKNTFKTNLKRNFALLAYLALSPIFFIRFAPSNHISAIPLDKVFHYFYYLFFALWLLWAKTKAQSTFLVLFILGFAIEGLQELTGYRSYELIDLMANTAGICSAIVFFKLKNHRD